MADTDLQHQVASAMGEKHHRPRFLLELDWHRALSACVDHIVGVRTRAWRARRPWGGGAMDRPQQRHSSKSWNVERILNPQPQIQITRPGRRLGWFLSALQNVEGVRKPGRIPGSINDEHGISQKDVGLRQVRWFHTLLTTV